MKNLIFIASGGAVGAVCRYLLSHLMGQSINDIFPWGTLLVNLVGSFLIGFLYTLFDEFVVNAEFRNLLAVGVIGAFTTFSTYSLETLNLFRDGELKGGIINILASNGGGLACVFLGVLVSKCLVKIVRGAI